MDSAKSAASAAGGFLAKSAKKASATAKGRRTRHRYYTQPDGTLPKLKVRPGGLEMEVVGVRHHWDAVSKVAGRRPKDDDYRVKNVTLRLVREPDNPHDANAVAVYHPKHGHLGYIGKGIAAQLAPGIDDASKSVGKPYLFEVTAEMEAEWCEDENDAGKTVWALDEPSITLTLDEGLQANLKPAK